MEAVLLVETTQISGRIVRQDLIPHLQTLTFFKIQLEVIISYILRAAQQPIGIRRIAQVRTLCLNQLHILSTDINSTKFVITEFQHIKEYTGIINTKNLEITISNET